MITFSRRGVLEIAGHEGIVLGPYRDSAGVWTYGVGHTAGAGAPDPAAMPRTDTRRWSEETAHKDLVRAIRLFDEDLDSYETRVEGAIQVPLKQHQFDALVSWDFNTGGATWRSSSGLPCQLVRQINAGDMSGAGFMGWLRPPEIRQRRTEEMNLFRTGRYRAGSDAIAVWDALGDGRIRHRATITAAELGRLMDEADAQHRAATGGVLTAIQRFFATIFRRNP